MTALDIDGIPQGPAEDPAFNPEDGVERAIGLIDDAAPGQGFVDGSFWWQYTSSQGLEPDKLNLRLWAIAAEPVSDEGMRRWALAVNRRAGLKLVDPSLYNPVQPHYLAAPVLDGIPDPLPRRSGFRRGLSDTVEIVAPEPPRLVAAGDGAGLKPAHGFESYLAEIGGEHGFHNSVFRAICSYVGTHGVGGHRPRGAARAAARGDPRRRPRPPQPRRDRALHVRPLPRRPRSGASSPARKPSGGRPTNLRLRGSPGAGRGRRAGDGRNDGQWRAVGAGAPLPRRRAGARRGRCAAHGSRRPGLRPRARLEGGGRRAAPDGDQDRGRAGQDHGRPRRRRGRPAPAGGLVLRPHGGTGRRRRPPRPARSG